MSWHVYSLHPTFPPRKQLTLLRDYEAHHHPLIIPYLNLDLLVGWFEKVKQNNLVGGFNPFEKY